MYISYVMLCLSIASPLLSSAACAKEKPQVKLANYTELLTACAEIEKKLADMPDFSVPDEFRVVRAAIKTLLDGIQENIELSRTHGAITSQQFSALMKMYVLLSGQLDDIHIKFLQAVNAETLKKAAK